MKPKPSPTSPKAQLTTRPDIDKLYEESMKTFERPKETKVRLSISLLISIIIIGFVSGIVGQFALLSYGPDIPVLQQLQIFNTDNTSVILTNSNKQNTVSAEEVEVLARDLSSSIVAVFEEKEVVTGIEANYIIGQRVADGLVMTDDGYIVVAAGAISDDQSYVVTTKNHEEYRVEKIITDQRGGFTYLKIDAQNLESIGFASTEALYTSEEILLLDSFANRGIPSALKVPLLAKNYLPEESTASLVHSSEDFQDTLLLGDAIPSNFTQRLAFTLDKKALGMVQVSDGQYSVIPFSRINSVVEEVLAGNAVSRPFLGISYVNLSDLNHAPTDAAIGYSDGAFVYSINDDNPSIIENSPAEKAGLEDEDIITQIDGITLNEQEQLASIIMSHRPGDTIALTVLRDDTEQSISITLDPTK